MTGQSFDFLDNPDLRLILFGGKGGTGKTTCAAASALHFARQQPGRNVLLVSTDPAHSLSDSLDWPVGGAIAPVAGVRNLFALALDTAALVADFNRRNGAVMHLIASRGTYFDQDDIASLFTLSLPGMDEVMAIVQIMDLMRGPGTCDTLASPMIGAGQAFGSPMVILDTAPAGHTMRLLALPEHMQQWIRVMDMMLEKHRYMIRRFRGRYEPDDADRFLIDLGRDVQSVRDLLRDVRSTEFVPVVNAEAMSIYETEALFQMLKEGGIPVRSVILNRLAEPRETCPFCLARGEGQASYAAEIAAKFGDHHLVTVPLLPREVRGVAALTDFGERLFGSPCPEVAGELLQVHARDVASNSESGTERCVGSLVAGCDPGTPRTRLPRAKHAHTDTAPRLRMPAPENAQVKRREAPDMADLLTRDRRIILVGGKGGVGKTTVAAATALALARRTPAEKVLIFSTDPASALPDCLGCAVGDAPTAVEGAPGIYAVQVNSQAGLADLRERYMTEINEVFESFLGGSGMDVAYDRDVMLELISLIPPGLDEIIALISLMDLLAAAEGGPARGGGNRRASLVRFDHVVLDTAPTGHMLRLLEMPSLAIDWFGAFFRLLLKYQGVVTLTRTAQVMVQMFRGVKKVQAHLADAQHTQFVAVTIPEAMGVHETERFLDSLDSMRVPCQRLIVNMAVPPTDCAFCEAKRAEQQEYIKALLSKYPRFAVTELPLFPHEVRGLANLAQVGELLYGGEA